MGATAFPDQAVMGPSPPHHHHRVSPTEEVPQSKVALLSWDQNVMGSPVQTGPGGMAGSPTLGKAAGGGRGTRRSLSPSACPGILQRPTGTPPLDVRWLRLEGLQLLTEVREDPGASPPRPPSASPAHRRAPAPPPPASQPRPQPPAWRSPADPQAVTNQGHSAAPASSCGRDNVGEPDPGGHRSCAPDPERQGGPPPGPRSPVMAAARRAPGRPRPVALSPSAGRAVGSPPPVSVRPAPSRRAPPPSPQASLRRLQRPGRSPNPPSLSPPFPVILRP